jgi:hypothetical protein
MNGSDTAPDRNAFLQITKALRFAFVALILGVSYPNLRCALAIPAFQNIYHDILGGKPLPAATEFVIHAYPVLVALSISLPVVAVLSLFMRRLSFSIYLVGFIIIAVIVQLSFTWQALSNPLFSIAQNMQTDTH